MIDRYMLENALKDSGLKREKVAELLGMTRFTLLRKIRGDTEFTASELAALKSVLRLNTTAFRRIFFASESECNSH